MFVIFLLLFPISLLSECLSVAINSTTNECSGESEFIQNSISLGEIYVGEATEKTFAIYLKSDSSDAITIKIIDIKSLNNSNEEAINPSFSFISAIDNSQIDITSNQPFLILPSGNSQYRDGNIKVGDIKVVIPNIDTIQTDGSYSSSYEIIANIDGQTNSNSNTLGVSLNVPRVSYVGFENVSSFKKDTVFIGGIIDFGLLSGGSSVIKDIYAKHNSNLNLKMVFETTPNLVHSENSNYFLEMKYYFKTYNGTYQSIVAQTPFTILSNKNSGVLPIGEIKFELLSIEGKIAGLYSGVISISIVVE